MNLNNMIIKYDKELEKEYPDGYINIPLNTRFELTEIMDAHGCNYDITRSHDINDIRSMRNLVCYNDMEFNFEKHSFCKISLKHVLALSQYSNNNMVVITVIFINFTFDKVDRITFRIYDHMSSCIFTNRKFIDLDTVTANTIIYMYNRDISKFTVFKYIENYSHRITAIKIFKVNEDGLLDLAFRGTDIFNAAISFFFDSLRIDRIDGFECLPDAKIYVPEEYSDAEKFYMRLL